MLCWPSQPLFLPVKSEFLAPIQASASYSSLGSHNSLVACTSRPCAIPRYLGERKLHPTHQHKQKRHNNPLTATQNATPSWTPLTNSDANE